MPKAAFGAQELARLPGPDGGIGHAEIRIGDSVVMMFDARDGWADTPAFLRLYVPDADAAYHRALAAGATPVTQVTALFFGDRVGRNSIYRFDDRMIVTPFLYRARGFEHPAFQLRRLSPFGMFERYAAQFEDVWATVRPLA